MKPYVMFGVHPLFGEYVDAIHASGGCLARVVLNVKEPDRPPGRGFSESMAKYHQWRQARGIAGRVEVLWLDEYRPRTEEIPLFGFRGIKAGPLVAFLKEKFGIYFPPLIHPAAYVSSMATIGEGVFVAANATIASNSQIGDFTLVNRNAAIGHDAIVEKFVFIGPAASTASWVLLGEGSVLGIASTVIDGIKVGAGSYVAAGSVVIRDIPPGRLVAGVPAEVKRIIRPGSENDEQSETPPHQI